MTPTSRRLRSQAISSALLALGLLLGPAYSGIARADEPAIYLTWHAPWGQPGATDTLTTDCDSTKTDSLWLAINPGITSPTMLGVSVTLLFHPAPGETLSTIWRKSFIEEKPRLLTVDVAPDPGLGYPQMFKINGVGAGSLDMTGHIGRLRIDYATPHDDAIGVTPKIYAFACVVFKRPGPLDSRCGEPVCIDWSELELGVSQADDRPLRTHGPHRFVSLNSPGGAIAETFRAGERHSWKPPGEH
jgi:hypothetical protein